MNDFNVLTTPTFSGFVADAVDFLGLRGWSAERRNGAYLLPPPAATPGATQVAAAADVIDKARESCADVY
jgi:hypothetical protein